MGNGVSTGQRNLPTHDKRDVRTSVCEEQHDWPKEQAEAPEIHSLQHTRKPYSGAQLRGSSSTKSMEVDTRLGDYSDAQARGRESLKSADYRNRKWSVMKDDKTSSVMQDDGSSSTEDERDDFRGAQQRDQRSSRLHQKSPSPQTENSSSDEEEQERRSSRRREKTRGNTQVEPSAGQTAYVQVRDVSTTVASSTSTSTSTSLTSTSTSTSTIPCPQITA